MISPLPVTVFGLGSCLPSLHSRTAGLEFDNSYEKFCFFISTAGSAPAGIDALVPVGSGPELSHTRTEPPLSCRACGTYLRGLNAPDNNPPRPISPTMDELSMSGSRFSNRLQNSGASQGCTPKLVTTHCDCSSIFRLLAYDSGFIETLTVKISFLSIPSRISGSSKAYLSR